MTLNQLRYFLAVCECGKLRTAAERLHIAESSISVAIKHLEEEFGFPLFYRSKKQLTLTDEGTLLQSKAIAVVESFDQLENQMKERKKSSIIVRLAMPHSVGELLGPSLTTAFQKDAPSVHFKIQETSSRPAVQQVIEGKSDLAIIIKYDTLPTQLDFSQIIKTNMSGYVRDDHPLAHQTGVTLQMIKNEKLILHGQNSTTTKIFQRLFQEAGVEPNIYYYATKITLFPIKMVKELNAVAFFMDDLLRMNEEATSYLPDDIASFSFNPPIQFSIGIIRKKDAPLSKEALHFYEFCKHYLTN